MKKMSEGGAKTGEGRRGRRGRKTRPSMGRRPVRREGKTIIAARAPSGGAGGCGRRGGRLRRGLPAAHGPGGQPTLLPTPPPSLSPSLSLSLSLSLSAPAARRRTGQQRKRSRTAPAGKRWQSSWCKAAGASGGKGIVSGRRLDHRRGSRTPRRTAGTRPGVTAQTRLADKSGRIGRPRQPWASSSSSRWGTVR
jgi:hypothetical protein